MQLIKLDATTSTNTYLKELATKKNLDDFTVAVTNHQIQGRGQKGNSWVSEKGKNLTVSVLKKLYNFKTKHAFSLNIRVSLAIYDVLKALEIPKLTIKWPNDIMSGNQKLCGILIENTLQGDEIKRSIIGFGLNVNQEQFSELPNATSLKLKTGKEHNLDNLLEKISQRLKFYFNSLDPLESEELKKAYESVLFRRSENSLFLDKTGTSFQAKLLGITDDGLLKLEANDYKRLYFGFKEVTFIY